MKNPKRVKSRRKWRPICDVCGKTIKIGEAGITIMGTHFVRKRKTTVDGGYKARDGGTVNAHYDCLVSFPDGVVEAVLERNKPL